MMHGVNVDDPASAAGRCGKGLVRRNRRVRSSGAESSLVTAISDWPNGSRAPNRLMLAAASRASTGVPSWNRNPSRSRSVHIVPSFSTVWPSTICGWAVKSLIQAIQRIEHQIGVVMRRPERREDRIEQAQIATRNELQRSFALRPRDMWRGKHRRTGR